MGSTGFLSFNKRPPQLHVCGEDDAFDPATLRFFRDEGFGVTYHSLSSGRPAFQSSIAGIADTLELGEYYALVAYGAAAAVCLQLAQKPMPRLCALVAYYPNALPSPNFKYPSQLPLVLHLAGAQNFGAGASVKSYWYRGTEEGFAEMDLAEYEPVAAGLAWSRTLATLRNGFNISVDLESVWEEHLQRKQPPVPLPLVLLRERDTIGILKFHCIRRHYILFFVRADELIILFSHDTQTSTRAKMHPRPWPP